MVPDSIGDAGSARIDDYYRLLTRIVPKFKQPVVEKRFIEYYSSSYYRFAQISVCFGFLLLMGDFAADKLAYPDMSANFLRLTVGAPLTLLVLAFSFTKYGKDNWQAGMSIFLLTISSLIFVILRLVDSQGGTGLMSWVGILNFTFMEFYGFLILGIRFRYSLITGAIILLVFLIAVSVDSRAMLSPYWLYHVITLFLLVAGIGWWREYVIRKDFAAGHQLADEKKRHQVLLESLVPRGVLDRINAGEDQIADVYPMVSVLFADLRGFTSYANKVPPERLVGILQRIFSGFDRICSEFDLDKIKTIGDAYMATSGVRQNSRGNAENVLMAGRSMIAHLRRISRAENIPLGIRVGIHSGKVVGGVLDVKKPQFDIWGDVVNLASRMESTGEEGKIQVSEATWNLLRDKFRLVERGEIEVKGLSQKIRTYLHDPETDAEIHNIG